MKLISRWEPVKTHPLWFYVIIGLLLINSFFNLWHAHKRYASDKTDLQSCFDAQKDCLRHADSLQTVIDRLESGR